MDREKLWLELIQLLTHLKVLPLNSTNFFQYKLQKNYCFKGIELIKKRVNLLLD